MKKSLLLILFPVALGAGCVATHDDMGNIYARQSRLEAKTKKLEQRVEEMQYQPGSESFSASEQKIAELEQRIAVLERSQERLTSAVQRTNRYSSADPVIPSDSEKLIENGTTRDFATTEVDQEAVIFNRGYKFLSENKYEYARGQFSEFLQKYPQSPQSSDAAFWIAESYFRQGLYEEAILDFQKFIEDYDKDIKVPLAYYKQGESLVSIDRKEEAIIFFQTLIDKFPQSEEARSAKEKLRTLQ